MSSPLLQPTLENEETISSIEDRTPYDYPRLEEAKSIRILRLHGGDADVLSGELVETTTDQAPPYEAISYCWGSPETTHTIVLTGGFDLRITESLYNALRAIRHDKAEDGPRDVWVDGVCVNQTDLDERGSQVKMMPEIYGSASRVITYIGEDTANVELGIQLANNLISRSEGRNETLGAAATQASDMRETLDPSIVSLRDFLHRRWYSRIWIIQESLLNENMIMMCGKAQIPWQVFTKIVDPMQYGEFNQYCALLPNTDRQVEALCYMARMRGEYLSWGMSLLDLLIASRNLDCSDPRDRVFALSSLSKDVQITPNYNQTKAEVFTETANRLLSACGMEVLSYAGSKRTEDIPSWVPDWSTMMEQVPILQCREYNAAGCLRKAATPTVLPNGALRISSRVYDKIVHVTDTMQRTLLSGRMARYSWARSEYQRISTMSRTYQGSKMCLDAIWRTLICDAEHSKDCSEKNIASEGLARSFEVYVRPSRSWAREEAIEGIVKHDPSRLPRPPEVDPVVLKAWRSDLSFDASLAHTAEGQQNVFSPLRRRMAVNQRLQGDDYRDAILHAGNIHRKMFTTKSGYIGMGPSDMQVGDALTFFPDAKVPFILRPLEASACSEYKVIGDCYAHGLMNGEVARRDRNGGLTRAITLV